MTSRAESDTRTGEAMTHDREHHEGCASEGYGGKFEVRRTDGSDQPGGRHHGCRYLVLDLDHDPSARHVARIYAEDIETSRGVFAHELLDLLRELGAVPMVPIE
jgi:hypothetical protein